ncbi:DUF2829 domain-containing protein [Xenorhabdus sp. XENO-10]|uniref:DUF2829 domain-containing protein n=1 Tax=Xenorhabdus yunnanensis TaxID=3025878 RepID=A0ABT5LKH1_9GAMM|nr:DUF2829 domain-containing protein [Xenorhabdus yunnanensis]MDC9591515.1 DUF2829 domain-containing protein [Xenorhabdus yunnanensis]
MMTEFNNPANMDTNQKCLFDPEQYKVKYKTHTIVEIDNDVTAPVGSFPWAMIQLYIGKEMSRKDWNSVGEYIRFSHERTDLSPQIEKGNENGPLSMWQPTQKDMMACDWQFFESEKDVLSADITLGTGKVGNNGGIGWGYAKNNPAIFGSLSMIHNKENFMEILEFYWREERFDDFSLPFIELCVSLPNTQDSDKMYGLKNETLYITIDNVTYSLDKAAVSNRASASSDSRVYSIKYYGDQAKNLGAVLKQTGETKRLDIKRK